MVVIQSVPAKEFNPADLTTLAGLTNVVTTSAVAKGHAVLATQLAASTTAISLPPGLDAVTVSMSGVNGLAGYLQPGSQVDVYAYVSKLSTATTATQTATSSIPLPSTCSTWGCSGWIAIRRWIRNGCVTVPRSY